MANPKTITAANSQFVITIPGVYSTPQILRGYAADSGFAFGQVKPAEVVMGVDGNMSAGYTPYMTEQTINIMPDSPSLIVFQTWLQACYLNGEVFFANAQITLPSINQVFTLTKGVLSGAKAAPDVKKVLQAVEYQITWNLVEYKNI
jgi:hypothetical protein